MFCTHGQSIGCALAFPSFLHFGVPFTKQTRECCLASFSDYGIVIVIHIELGQSYFQCGVKKTEHSASLFRTQTKLNGIHVNKTLRYDVDDRSATLFYRRN